MDGDLDSQASQYLESQEVLQDGQQHLTMSFSILQETTILLMGSHSTMEMPSSVSKVELKKEKMG